MDRLGVSRDDSALRRAQDDARSAEPGRASKAAEKEAWAARETVLLWKRSRLLAMLVDARSEVRETLADTRLSMLRSYLVRAVERFAAVAASRAPEPLLLRAMRTAASLVQAVTGSEEGKLAELIESLFDRA